jgi:WD40 repeat protein
MRFGDARLRHTAPVESLALSGDGSRLLTATRAEPVLRLWSVKTGHLLRAVRVTEELTTSMTVLALTPDVRTALVIRHQKHQRERANPWHEPALIDLATGTVVRWTSIGREEEERHPVFALSPDGTVVAALTGGEVRVWECGTGRERALGKIPNPNESEGGLCFSPNGSHVAACRSKGALFLAPINGNGPLQRVELERCPEDILQVFWPAPDRVVALWRHGLIALDPTSGHELRRARLFEGNIYNLARAAAGGGKLFGQEYYHPIGTFDLTTLDRVPDRAYPCTLHDEFAASADGRVVAVARDHAVDLFDTGTGKPLHPELQRAPVRPFERLDTVPDGSLLLGSTDGAAYVLALSDGRGLAQLGDKSRSETRFAISPDGRFVSGASSKAARRVVIELRTGRAVLLPEGTPGLDPPEVIGFAGPDRVWQWCEETNVFVPLELGTYRAGTAVPGFEGTLAVAVSPDGSRLAASGQNGLAVRTLRADRGWVILDTYESRRRIPRCMLGRFDAVPVRFSPCGRWLLVSESTGLELWDVRNRPARVGQFEAAGAGRHQRNDAAFSPDGRFLAGAVRTRDGGTELCVWETASGSEVYRFRPARGVAGAAFIPNGRRLVIAHLDTTLGVWDRATLEARLCGAVPAGEEWQVLASRDARRARAAVLALVADPNRALTVLAEGFAPPDARVTGQLVSELGAEDFPVRERAHRALAALGTRAEPSLRNGVAHSESPEVRARAEALLKALGANEGRVTGDRLRAVRAVAVLEMIASPEAKALLAKWAATYPNSPLAAEASAALARMGPSSK